MKKNEIRWYIVLGVLFAIFTVISFAVPFTQGFGFWSAYVFGVIAIVLQVYFYKASFQNGEDTKSKFYGFPIAKIGVIYFAVQLIISLLSMILATFVPNFPNWIFVIIDVVILGAAVIGCISAETMRDEIVRQDVSLKKDVSCMRNLQSLVAMVVSQCGDAETKKILEELSDEVRYSDPVSCEASKSLELDITESMNEIQKALIESDWDSAKDLAAKVKGMLLERNRICKVNK